MKKWIGICLVSMMVLFCTTSVAKARMTDQDIHPVRIVSIFEKTFIKDFGHAMLFSGIHSKPMIVLSFDADVREVLIPADIEHKHPEDSSEIIEDPSESEQQSEEFSSQDSSKPEDSHSRPQESSSKPQEGSSSRPQESSSQSSSSRPQESSSQSSQRPQESSSKIEESSSQSESSQPPHNHDYRLTKTENATCEENGYREYACNCGQAYREKISATGHAWEPQYTTVHHEEEGHWATVNVTTTEEVQVWVVDQEAWDEEILVQEAWEEQVSVGQHNFCNECGMDLTANQISAVEHSKEHVKNGGYGGWHTDLAFETIYHEAEYATIHHPEEGHYETQSREVIKEAQQWVVDKAAYDEKVLTGYLCSTCGKGKE